MAGYIRQSSFSDGDTITAALFNNEYNQILNAFSNTSGHAHDGTAAEGPVIGLIGDAGETAPNNKVLIDTTNNYIEFYVQVSSSPVQQLYIADGAIVPVTDNDIDLGTSSLEFKDGYFDGTLYADAINFNGTAITSTAAELNILDGVTASATDINLIDGITNGTVIASKAIITDSNKDITGGRNITISGELDAATLDISGDADIDGTLEADAITIAGVTLAETISDTVGAMVGSNTETGISVTYDDSDNTLDFVIGADSIVSSMLDTNIDIAGTLDVTGVLTADTNATVAGTLGVAGGSTNGVAISQGAIAIKNGGAKSYIDLYCESSNAHYTRIEAAAHSAYSGNVTATLPVTTGTLAITSEIPTTEQIQDIVGAMVSSNTETNITITYQDSDGTLDFVVDAAQPNVTSLGTLTSLTVDDITIDSSTISDASDLTIDVGGDIILDADGGNITFKDGGTAIGDLSNSSSDFVITSSVQDKDIIFKGDDNGSAITALTLDMSDAGTAIFNHDIKLGDAGVFIGTGNDLRLEHDGTDSFVTNYTGDLKFTQTVDDKDIIFDCDDGSGGLARYITIDGSAALTQFDKHTKHSDSIRADFGNSSDLQIYHDGSHSYVQDTGTGSLLLCGTNLALKNGAGTENYLNATENGALYLFYDNAEKLRTESNGVTITGSLAATLSTNAQPNITSLGTLTTLTVDDITINGSTISDGGDLTVDSGGDIILDAAGNEVIFKDAGTEIGHISMSGSNITIKTAVSDEDFLVKGNDGGVEIDALVLDMSEAGAATFNAGVTATTGTYSGLVTMGGIEVDQYVTHAGDTNTYLEFGTDQVDLRAGNVKGLVLKTSEVVINEDSADVDFRVESNSNANMLFVNGGTDKVGIGTASPTTQITASTSANITQVAITSSSNAVAWDATAAANAYHVTTENTTFSAPSNAVEGAIISVELAQGGTARTVAWNTVFEFAASTAPTVTATANKTDIFSFRYNGSVWQEIGRVQNMAQT